MREGHGPESMLQAASLDCNVHHVLQRQVAGTSRGYTEARPRGHAVRLNFALLPVPQRCACTTSAAATASLRLYFIQSQLR